MRDSAEVEKHSMNLEVGRELGLEPGICIRICLQAIENSSSLQPERSPEAGHCQVG